MTSTFRPRISWALRLTALYALIFVLLVMRRPDAVFHAQFWAEDGAVFFHGALFDGFGSLFTPYGGYLQVVPRAIALAALVIPFAFQPLVYDLFALGISAAVFTAFASPAYRYVVRSDAARAAIGVAAALAPFVGEILGDITNIQWYLALGALLLMLYRPQNSSILGSVLRGIAAAACAFSAPLTIIWIPLAMRILAVPRNRERTTSLIVAVGAIFEVVSSAITLPSTHQPFSIHVLATALLATYAFRVVIPTLLGEPTAISLTAVPYLAVVFTAIVTVGSAIAFRTRLQRYRAASVWLWIVASLGISLVGRNFVTTFGSVRHFAQFGGERYFFIGSVLLVFLCGSALAARLRRAYLLVPAAIVVFSLASFRNFQTVPFADLHWRDEAGVVSAWSLARTNHASVHAVSLPINPAGWAIALPGCESPLAERAAAGLTCPPAER